LTHPRNREVYIYHIDDEAHNHILHKGYSVEMVIDYRDYKAVSAYLVPGGILLRLPAISGPHRHHLRLPTVEGPVSSERVKQSRSLHSIAFDDAVKVNDLSVLVHYLFIKFPADIELSNTVYSPNSKDGKILRRFLPTEDSTRVGSNLVELNICRVAFKVNVYEETQRRVAVDTSDPEPTEEEEMSAAMNGMNRR
jgi:hypothetical protein